MEKTLVITIPTYNRKKFLVRLLGQLRMELSGIEDRVSVCILDNASVDDTYNSVNNFESKYELKYIRNEKNIGYDANVAKSILESDGRYVWLMGDDDLFIKGRIKEVLKFVEKIDSEIGGIFTNYYRYGTMVGLPLKTDNAKIYLEGEYDDDFYTSVYGSNFIGCAILNRKICEEVIDRNLEYSEQGVIKKNLDRNRVILREFIQQYLSFECIGKSKKFAIFPRPCTQYVGDGAYSSMERMLSSGRIMVERLEEFERYYPNIFKYSACPFLNNNPKGLIQTAVLFDPEMNNEHKEIYYESVGAMIAYYNRHKDAWGGVYSMFFWMHRNVLFFDKMVWHTYRIVIHMLGRKTYREREDDKKNKTKVRKTEF